MYQKIILFLSKRLFSIVGLCTIILLNFLPLESLKHEKVKIKRNCNYLIFDFIILFISFDIRHLIVSRSSKI